MSGALAICKTCEARRQGFCSEFAGMDLFELASVKLPTRRLAPGTDIYRQGDAAGPYHVIRSGWIALSVLLDDGRRHIYDFALPGAFLGLAAAPPAPCTHTARCMTDAQVCSLPRQQLNALVDARPRAVQRLLHIMVCNEARLQDHFVNISGRAARARIAHLMVELFCRVHGRLPEWRGDHVVTPLTQSIIGEATSLTPVHVSRTLTALQDEGMMSFVRGVLTVLDPEQLLAAAGTSNLTRSTAIARQDACCGPIQPTVANIRSSLPRYR